MANKGGYWIPTLLDDGEPRVSGSMKDGLNTFVILTVGVMERISFSQLSSQELGGPLVFGRKKGVTALGRKRQG